MDLLQWERLTQRLDSIQGQLSLILAQEAKMAEDLSALTKGMDDLKAEVTDLAQKVSVSAANSDELLAELLAAIGSQNQAAIDDLSAKLRAEIDNLHAAGASLQQATERDTPPGAPGPQPGP